MLTWYLKSHSEIMGYVCDKETQSAFGKLNFGEHF